jgi:CheY-like chemotaxis protein
MAYRFERVKVLVVDDNPHMRALVSALLKALDIRTVYEAAGADAAWDVLKHNPCDLVLLDWVMSGASGLELAQHIRTAEDSPNPFIPIVMLTGHTNREYVRQARDAGVNDFLAKPVSAKAILSRLLSVIENPRPFVRTKMYFGPCRRRHREAYEGPERRADAACEGERPDATAAAG